jgi:carboxymethylenebutenolidase
VPARLDPADLPQSLGRLSATVTQEGAVYTEEIVLASDGDRRFSCFMAGPDASPAPALVIFTEMWGVTDSRRQLARSYAARGYCAVVPNRFWRCEDTGVITDEAAAWTRLRVFDFDVAASDVCTVVEWLRSSPRCSGKIAALGFCMGGRIAFLAASRAKVDAAISLYALGIASHLDEFGTISGRLQLHYGLADRHIPRSEIDAVAAAARGKSNIEVFLYPGAGHGFFNTTRPAYDAAAVALATERIDGLLGAAVPVVAVRPSASSGGG